MASVQQFRTATETGDAENTASVTPQLGRHGGARMAFGMRTHSGGATMPVAPFRYVAILHVAEDAAFADLMVARLGQEFPSFAVKIDPAGPQPKLNAAVATVVLWSHAAIAAGAGRALESHIRYGLASVVVVRDATLMPARFSEVQRLGVEGDDAALAAEALGASLRALNAAAPSPVVALDVEERSGAQLGFVGGIAASVAIFGTVGVGGYVVVPALNVHDVASVAPTAAVASVVAERDTGLPVIYGEAVAPETPYVAARFGSFLQVSFSGEAPALVAPAPVIEVAAVADAAPAAAEAATAAFVALDGLSAIESPELAIAPMVMAVDVEGLAPSFITDVAIEEPFID